MTLIYCVHRWRDLMTLEEGFIKRCNRCESVWNQGEPEPEAPIGRFE